MMQVHKDMICSKCNSVNENEQVTRTDENRTVMLTRCKACGHEHEDGSVIAWSDTGDTMNFVVTDWYLSGPEVY